jgi:phosphoribosylformimino-5-aminoimidazole carboxamide ribotide isomerase
MILYPAIDLKDGACVRLKQGRMSEATIFNADPAAQAARFAAAGFSWLHLVDLDGAFAGRPVNGAAVERILRAVAIPVQLGGGIRDSATIEHWLDRGIARVILGTLALSDPDAARRAMRDFPGRIALGLDARAGKVAVEGWSRTTATDALDLARAFEDAGAAAIIYTDVERDGLLGGVDVDGVARLAAHLKTPVIASGGLASLGDIQALRAAGGRPIAGAILGRALYDGRFTAAAALAAAKEG